MTRRRVRGRARPPRCQHCGVPIRFFLAPFGAGGRWLPFDPAPVDANFSDRSYPVLGRKAWDRNELLAELQVMRGCDVQAAADEVNDMTWHQLHRCPPGAAAWRRDTDREGISTT